MSLHAPAVQLLLAFIAGCPVCCIAAGDSCAGLPLPSLDGCFYGQPPQGTHSCYKVVAAVNGTSEVQCLHPAPGDMAGGAVRRCKDGHWETGNTASCGAASHSVWRVVVQETTLRGWWLHDLQFYTDSSCRKPLPEGAVRLTFASGPNGPVSMAPHAALDGDASNWWRAPCAGSDTIDFCGCRRDLDEGWSVAEKRCVPGLVTNGLSEKDCVAFGANYSEQQLGCPAGQASLGIHLAAAYDIGCVRMLQYDSSALSTREVSLEAWSDGAWQEVKRFSGLTAGTWQTLNVRKACPIFQLPNYASKWTRIMSMNAGGAGDGDELAVGCVDGSKETSVTCMDGKWSPLPMISCFQPVIPSLPSSGGSAKRPAEQQEREGMDSSVEMLLWLVGCVFGVGAVLGMLHLGRMYLQHQAWKSFKNNCAKPSEPDPEAMPKLALSFPPSFPTASPHGRPQLTKQPSPMALENNRQASAHLPAAKTSSARTFHGPTNGAPIAKKPPAKDSAGPSKAQQVHEAIGHPMGRGQPAARAAPSREDWSREDARGPPVAHGLPVALKPPAHGGSGQAFGQGPSSFHTPPVPPPAARGNEEARQGDSWRGEDRRWRQASNGPMDQGTEAFETNRQQMQTGHSFAGEPPASTQHMHYHTPQTVQSSWQPPNHPNSRQQGNLRDAASNPRLAANPALSPDLRGQDPRAAPIAVRQSGQSWRSSRTGQAGQQGRKF